MDTEDAVFHQPAYDADEDSEGDFGDEEDIVREQKEALGDLSESAMLEMEGEMSIEELRKLYAKDSQRNYFLCHSSNL
jgi:hypothetical protein